MKIKLLIVVFSFLFVFESGYAQKKVTTAQVKKRISNVESKSKKAPQDYLDLAQNYYLLKDYDQAMKNAKLGNSPQTREGLEMVAKVSRAKKDFLEEVRALEIIKSLGKVSPAHHIQLGEAYANLNKEEEAIKNFRKAQELAPKFERAYVSLYQFYLNKKNTFEARATLLNILEIFGEKPRWLNEFCKIEIEEKYFENAKAVCQKAIEKSPKVADNHVYLALAFKYTEAEDQSRKILFAAAKRFLGSEATQREAGLASQKVQNYELAETFFSRCFQINSTAGDCGLELAKSQFQIKKYEEALNSFMKACPYLKEVELEMRRHAYDLEKLGQPKLYKKYMDLTGKCQSEWFNHSKKAQK